MGKSQWTIDTLKQLMDERFTAQEKATNTAFLNEQNARRIALESTEKAILKAEIAMDKRLDGMNELRESMNDLTNTFIPRKEVQVMMENVNKQLQELNTFKSQTQGQSSQGTTGRLQSNWVVGLVVTLIISAVSIIIALMKHS